MIYTLPWSKFDKCILYYTHGISDTVSLIFQNFENIIVLITVNLNGSYLISKFSEFVRYD